MGFGAKIDVPEPLRGDNLSGWARIQERARKGLRIF
jgi:hypothetical protein